MKPLSKDARGFVDSVVKYIKTDGKSATAGQSVRSLLSKVSDEDKKMNKAVVESAIGLTDAEKAEVEKIVMKLVGHEITIETSVRPSLLGGLRITVGDWILDTSLKAQLDDLKSTLI
jgi:F-type H+-transporting ATPase subunit delta